MKLGLMFFAGGVEGERPYQLLLDAARLADDLGLVAVWTPERHFHPFGGLYPNPAVTGAAVATVTTRIRIRAGSLIAPLHDVLRIVEEFAVVDNLSDGRVDVSFGSGWHPNDFALRPSAFASRRETTLTLVEEARRLWRGEGVTRTNGAGQPITVFVYPRPQQPELPVWLTAVGNPETFRAAGRLGANVLTHLVGQTQDALADNVAVYRAARREAGHDAGSVTVMMHTFIATDAALVASLARQPFKKYLESWMSLEQAARDATGGRGGGFGDELVEELRELTFRDYLGSRSLMGTPDVCKQRVRELQARGIDEIACLLDFGIPAGPVLDGIRRLADLNCADTNFTAEHAHD